jgi:hypothetical protein
MNDDTTKPAMNVLTEEQAAQVAGGLVIGPNPILGGGCLGCHSGLPILFQVEAANAAK